MDTITSALEAEDDFAWLEPGPAQRRVIYGTSLLPANGWDNAPDVAYFKVCCRNAAYTRRMPEDLRDMVERLSAMAHAQGVSPDVAAPLIHKFMKPDGYSRSAVHEHVMRMFGALATVPGNASFARATDPSWGSQDDDVWPTPVDYDLGAKKTNDAMLAEMFLAARRAKLIYVDGTFFTLKPNMVWEAISTERLASEIRATDPTDGLGTMLVKGMVEAIKQKRLTLARPFSWIEAPPNAPASVDLILFRNGILNFETGELLPHDGRFFATGFPDFDYEPSATCPVWMEKLDEWLHPSFHLTLQQFLGYILTSDTNYQALLALIGVSRGGKGTIMRVMRQLVGPLHTSIMMHDLANDFGLQGCTDRRVIFIPDAHSPKHPAAALERIKSIVGNDEVSVNRKHKEMLHVEIPAKLVVAANKHPQILDESRAMANRELLIVFRNSFKGREDIDLGKKLAAELPGIVNWAIEGLRRLRADGKFTVGTEGRAAIRELEESQSPARRFGNEYFEVTGNPKDRVRLQDVFTTYELWSSQEGLSRAHRRSRDGFKEDLVAAYASEGVRYERTKKRYRDPDGPKHGNGVPAKVFSGLRWKKPPYRDEDFD